MSCFFHMRLRGLLWNAFKVVKPSVNIDFGLFVWMISILWPGGQGVNRVHMLLLQNDNKSENVYFSERVPVWGQDCVVVEAVDHSRVDATTLLSERKLEAAWQRELNMRVIPTHGIRKPLPIQLFSSFPMDSKMRNLHSLIGLRVTTLDRESEAGFKTQLLYFLAAWSQTSHLSLLSWERRIMKSIPQDC